MYGLIVTQTSSKQCSYIVTTVTSKMLTCQSNVTLAYEVKILGTMDVEVSYERVVNYYDC